jgi:serine/threonine protein kinase
MIHLAGLYNLRAKIRETPSAQLYRGVRIADAVPVVVKLLRSQYPTPLELARLRHEYSIVKSLDSPYVVRALALEPVDHGLALVLEDAGDISLDRLIRSGKLGLRRALQIAVTLATAVAAIHAQQIVHKDLKPHHFFIKPEHPSDVTLIDFGIATRLSQQLQRAAPVGELEGSLPYIAPEQTGRMNRVIDRRSDLYALGVTLYEMFTGQLPFRTSDPLELVHSHLARRPPPPSEIKPELPSVLSEIILKLLSKAAEDRYQSAVGLRHDLQRSLEQLVTTGQAVTFTLADADASDELRIPQKLYGRQDELKQLLAALHRSQRGRAELLLVSGYSGVGKSALVGELQKETVRGGYLGAGKCEYLNRSIPYAPVLHACRQLIQAALAEPVARLAQRRRQLLAAFGSNGQVLIELLSDLELIIGAQPSVPNLGPSESQRRFELMFQSFLGAFGTPE